MKINIDELLANMPKDEDELKTVQEKHRKILTDNREKGEAAEGSYSPALRTRSHLGGLLSADHPYG